MDFFQNLSFRWISNFIKNPTEIHKTIFYSWLSNLKSHYQTLLQVDDTYFKNQKGISFLFKKTFRHFYPSWLSLHSPFDLPDIHKAIQILQEAFYKKETTKILFYGDRDVDGLTSISILRLFLEKEMKYNVDNLTCLVPEENDKYGICDTVVVRLLQYNPDILIIFDCGSSNKKELAFIKEKLPHLKIIIIDHHFIPTDIQDYPDVDAFINPKRLEILNPNRDLCSAGITYKVICGLMFSFTAEYNIVTQVNQNNESYYFQNGILITNKNNLIPKRIISFDQESNNTIISWNDAIKDLLLTNKDFYQLNTYLNKSEEKLTIEELFLLFFHAQLINIKKRTEPYISLACIGTVADIMPLTDDNRILVTLGLDQINNNSIKMLSGLFGIIQGLDLKSKKITEQDIGFFIAPLVNAAGRLGKTFIALDLLIESDRLDAIKKSYKLKEINEQRKLLSQEAIKLLDPIILTNNLDRYPIIVIYNEAIHRGISGLIANKIAEQYKKPALIMVDDNDCLRGSIRAYQNENVFGLLEKLSSFVIQFGGHRQAAGFSLHKEKLTEFMNEIHKHIREDNELFSKDTAVNNDVPMIHLSISELRSNVWSDCKLFAPYGQLNKLPLLSIQCNEDIQIKMMGDNNQHAKVIFKDFKESSIEGVWFFHNGEALQLNQKKNRLIIAEPQVNLFNGKSTYQFNIKKF